MPLNMKKCDDHVRDHATKVLPQSGHSTMRGLCIFNILCLFTKEPIREQEIKFGVYEFMP